VSNYIIVIIIELCVLDNTLQKLVGPIFAFDIFFDREQQSIAVLGITFCFLSMGKAFSQHRRDLSNISVFFVRFFSSNISVF